MPKQITWIVVADASGAAIYETMAKNPRISGAPKHRIEGPHRGHQDIESDRPGRTYDRVGAGRHAKEPATDPVRHEKALFAHEIASLLNKRRTQGGFERIVIVAPPQFLGDLRKDLTDDVKATILAEVAKDLSKLAPRALDDHLSDVLRPLARQ